MTDSLEFTQRDRDNVDYLDANSAMLALAIVRVVAETDWPSLTPDERAELLATLQFNASETLASIDGEES